MKFVVDANLAPRVAKALESAGHDAIHVADVNLLSATDEEIFDFATTDERIVLSSDTDFGTILARRNTEKPSFVLLRHLNELAPDEQFALLLANLAAVTNDLISGAIVTITPNKMRVRQLPIFP